LLNYVSLNISTASKSCASSQGTGVLMLGKIVDRILQTAILFALSTVAILLLPMRVAGQSGTVTDDAFLSSNATTQLLNLNGQGGSLIVAGATATVGTLHPGTTKTYINFQLSSSLPPATAAANVSKATLKLFLSPGTNPSGAIDIYPVTSPWTESTLATSPPNLSSTAFATGVAVGKTDQFLVVDVTQLVQQWLEGSANGGLNNDGIALLADTSTTYAVFDSKESIFTSHEPRLEIVLVNSGPQGAQGVPGPPGPPGPGSVTQINSGPGLIGGPITTNGALSLDTVFTNAIYAQLAAPNTFFGNQTINGAFSATTSYPPGALDPSVNSISLNTGFIGTAFQITSNTPEGNALNVSCTAAVGTDCVAIGASGTHIGGLFQADDVGLESTGANAGIFEGNVQVIGTLTKSAGSFKIDHPLDPANKYLTHSFVESPDMMNIYNGTVVLDSNGEAWISLPDWFEALNRDFRYQLTAIGLPGPNLYVAEEVSGNRFKVAGGHPGGKVSWQVTGIRHDAYADAHRLAVEEAKPEEDRGYYLHPEVHGQSPEKSLFLKHLRPKKQVADAAAKPGTSK
jgi:hypothetical protein